MPELPEVETIKRIVCPQLAGRTIETTEVRNAQVIAYPESKCFSKALSGQIISNMSRRGKFLTIQLENGDRLSLHLRMTGQLTVVPESEPVEKHTHLIFHLSGGSQLRYIDTDGFGCLGKARLIQSPGRISSDLNLQTRRSRANT